MYSLKMEWYNVLLDWVSIKLDNLYTLHNYYRIEMI